MKPHKGPHKYRKFERRGRKYWRCGLPNCLHYIEGELARDKETLCNRCEAPMILDKMAMRREKPICDPCKEAVYGSKRYDLVNRKYGKRYEPDKIHKEAVGDLLTMMELDIGKDK